MYVEDKLAVMIQKEEDQKLGHLKRKRQATMSENLARSANHWLVNMIFECEPEEKIEKRIAEEGAKYHELLNDDKFVD